MEIEKELLINKYGQNLIDKYHIISEFNLLTTKEKIIFLMDLRYLIIQSKAKNEDIELAINNSGLKPSYTPCIMIQKGINAYQLEKIAHLPENELEKSFILFINIFKIAYERRYILEKNNPNKWWYWDLSNEYNIKLIKNKTKDH